MRNKDVSTLQMSKASRPWQVLTLSAKTKTVLDAATINLVNHFKQQQHTSLADVAYTLQVDQEAGNYRRAVVCLDIDDAIDVLEKQDPRRIFNCEQALEEKAIIFMFSGQGTQYVNMGRELYQSEPLFRNQVDSCSEQLQPYLGLDLRTVLYPDDEHAKMALEQIHQAVIAQPALFVIEYALARLLMSYDITPQAMIGHSVGEYVAACLAGVISLEDALRIIGVRSRLIQQQPVGAMLAVPLSEQEVQPFLTEGISLAAVNSPAQCVIAGPLDAIASREKHLNEKGLETRRLHTSHAFHSTMMLPVATPFVEQIKQAKLHSPNIPFISNVTGTWITAEEATNPEHWRKELLQPVRFADGIRALLQKHDGILLEVGAGRTLSTLARQQTSIQESLVTQTSLRHPHDPSSDVAFFLNTLARLWVAGANVNWSELYAREQRRHIALLAHPVDRQHNWMNAHKLPQSDQKEFVQANSVLNTANELEQHIARAWQELLGIDHIGLDENFFKLGGDSLLASQLVARLRQTFHTEVPLVAIFENPTIAGIAEIVTHCKKASTNSEQIKVLVQEDYEHEEQLLLAASHLTDEEIEVLSINKIFPLSSAQRRLWFLDQLQQGSPVYHIAVTYRIKGELDVAALERSLNGIVKRHETLRTTFPVIGGQPMQIIAPSLTVKLAREDIEKLPIEQREAEVLQQAIREVQAPFNLAEGPLLRIKLLHLSGFEHVLFLTVHHIVFDGWSMGILYQELTTLYEAYVQGKPSPLPGLPIQYADYTAWEREWLQGEALKIELAYWKQQLTGIPPVLELPTDYPRLGIETFHGAYEAFVLPSILVEEVKELSQREGVTLFMTLLAAFQVLLARYSRQDDIVVGTDVANRSHIETENLIGFFVNQLVLRTNLSGNPSCSELLQQVREVVLGAFGHQNAPFDQLVRSLNPIRFPNRAPLFQVKLVLQNFPTPSKNSAISIDPLLIDPAAAQLDLLLALSETTSGLQGVWQYNTDLFAVNTIKHMSHHFSELLKAFVASASQTLSMLNVALNEEDARQRRLQQRQLAQLCHQRYKMVRSKSVTVIKQGE